eukprot:5573428-Pyramimonas_sp.AAC.1
MDFESISLAAGAMARPGRIQAPPLVNVSIVRCRCGVPVLTYAKRSTGYSTVFCFAGFVVKASL